MFKIGQKVRIYGNAGIHPLDPSCCLYLRGEVGVVENIVRYDEVLVSYKPKILKLNTDLFLIVHPKQLEPLRKKRRK